MANDRVEMSSDIANWVEHLSCERRQNDHYRFHMIQLQKEMLKEIKEIRSSAKSHQELILMKKERGEKRREEEKEKNKFWHELSAARIELTKMKIRRQKINLEFIGGLKSWE